MHNAVYFAVKVLATQQRFGTISFSCLLDISHLEFVRNWQCLCVLVPTLLFCFCRLLTLLDKGTMKLLIQNPRIEEFGRDFQPVLVEQLVDLQEHCPTRVRS